MNEPHPTRSTIAVLGASSDRRKYGNKCVRAYLQAGWTVFPVNLTESVIEGLPVHGRLETVEAELDRVSVYLPPETTTALLPEIAAIGAGEVWFNPGSATPDVIEDARELGIHAIDACSIVDIGLSPADFP